MRELLPFGRALGSIPMFLSVRLECLKKKWTGQPQTAMEVILLKYHLSSIYKLG